MHVTCPSCKFGGTVRDEQIPPEGKNVYCPNCNIRFRIKRDPSSSAPSRQTQRDTAAGQPQHPDSNTISCPACGFKGKIRGGTLTPGHGKIITCPSCKTPFTLTPPVDDSASRSDAAPSPALAQDPPSCPACGSSMPHALPICPSCGRILMGVKIHCPSCKSTNVGISDGSRGNGGSEWETMVFQPNSLTADKLADIHIPLSCRDCGKTWTIQPTRMTAVDKPAGAAR